MARFKVYGNRRCRNCKHGEGSHAKRGQRFCYGVRSPRCKCPGFALAEATGKGGNQ